MGVIAPLWLVHRQAGHQRGILIQPPVTSGPETTRVTRPQRFIGIMSGTSLDGVDAVLAEFSSGGRPALLAHARVPFASDLLQELHQLQAPGSNEIHRAALASQKLAKAYADSVLAVLRQSGTEANAVCAIGVHGQTVRHQPQLGYTVQLNAPALLAELTGIDVIADFRSRDLAAGGQGAPLVPAFHAALFGGAQAVAIVNIGGIANITGLPAFTSEHAPRHIIGFDSGPGNVLMDTWIAQHQGHAYDHNGAWAAQGNLIPSLLEQFLAEPYFALTPPKSTGRDLFHGTWLNRQIGAGQYAPVDVQATLAALSAHSIANGIKQYCPGSEHILVCGGGAFNGHLMQRLAQLCDGREVRSTQALGVAPDQVEALAFAWLAQQFIQRRPGSLTAVTGATGARVLGALYPR